MTNFASELLHWQIILHHHVFDNTIFKLLIADFFTANSLAYKVPKSFSLWKLLILLELLKNCVFSFFVFCFMLYKNYGSRA